MKIWTAAPPTQASDLRSASLQQGRTSARDRGVPIEFVLFAFGILAIVAGGVGIVAGVLNSPLNMMVVGDWYVMTSGFLIVVASTTERGKVLGASGCVLVAAAGVFVLLLALGQELDRKSFVKFSVCAAAAAAILAQFAVALRADGARRRDHLRVACFAAALVILPITSSWGVQITSFISHTYDRNLMAMDDALRIRIPALVRSAVWSNPILDYVTFHVYISVSLAMVAYDIVWRDFRNWRMTKLLLVTGIVGFAFYFIVPVSGTTLLAPDYNPPGAPIVLLPFQAVPRNCMPSLHTTWGLLLIAGSITRQKKNLLERAGSIVFALYGALTIVGALAYGDHYFFDCVVAVPFAGLVYALYKAFADSDFRSTGGSVLLATAASLFAVWIIAIRSVEPVDSHVVMLLLVLSLSFGLAVTCQKWACRASV